MDVSVEHGGDAPAMLLSQLLVDRRLERRIDYRRLAVRGQAIVGELQRARDLMERLLRVASPLGLYAEEFDAPTGRHLGNFPQAFSHLALIQAAARIILAERLEELTG